MPVDKGFHFAFERRKDRKACCEISNGLFGIVSRTLRSGTMPTSDAPSRSFSAFWPINPVKVTLGSLAARLTISA